MKNNEREVELKISLVDRMLNQNLMVIFLMLAVFCTICAVGCGLFVFHFVHSDFEDGAWYIALSDGFSDSFDTNWYGTTDAGWCGFLALFTFILLFANLVPISLYFTIEAVKMLTGFIIGWDIKMYDEQKELCAKCRNNNIIEEAGQVEYVLSDKTGTLTQNKMELMKFSAGGVAYGEGITEIEIGKAKRRNEQITPFVKPFVEGEEETFLFYDGDISGLAWLSEERAGQHGAISDFLWGLCICNTVVPQLLEDGTIKYNAASPDDGALVKACSNLGIRMKKRQMKRGGEFVFDVAVAPGQWEEQVWKVHEVIDFTSTRKRMSVIAESPEGKLSIFMKGADNFVCERLSASENEDEKRKQILVSTKEQTEDFSQNGLRTLWVASHELDKSRYEDWQARYDAALESKDAKAIAILNDELESGEMVLLGATAIEDKLQEEVGVCLSNIRKAQIKTWVLTGDKVGTAINIGYACELLQDYMEKVIITFEDDETGHERSRDEIMALFRSEIAKYKGQPTAAIIEGNALLQLGVGLDAEQLQKAEERGERMELEELQKEMILELKDCAAVLCCRVSPLQKGDLTRLVRTHLNKVTIGIGDGANDVGMITAAHVGVGVQGVEGSQAVNNADFAICKFKHLQNLVLVHGRWTYYRISKAICYFFCELPTCLP